jgi:hypothetical protein
MTSRMSSLSKVHDEFVQDFLEFMFPSLKSLKGKYERETSLQLEQWEGHGTRKSSSQDAKVEASLQEQPTEESSAKIGTNYVDKFYHENFNKYMYYHWL